MATGDLISRSELIAEIDKFCGNQRYLVPEEVRDIINEHPTAYNVDAVVEQLEKLHEETFKEGMKLKENTFGRTTAMGGIVALRMAIDIVKGGGVDGKD